MFKFFKKIKLQPRETRAKIFWVLSALAFFVVLGFWTLLLKHQITSLAKNKDENKKSFFQDIKASVNSGIDSFLRPQTSNSKNFENNR